MSEFDLSRGLRDLSGSPRIDGPAVPVDHVTRRVHRARAVRAAGITAACLAAVVGIAGAVWAIAPWDEPPVPPATPTPSVTPEPTQEPTAEPTRRPTPVVTQTPEPPESEAPAVPLVAMTAAGDLVVLDPETGAVERTIEGVIPGFDPDDDETEAAVSASPDGRTVYVSQGYRDADDRYVYEMLHVDLEDGSTERVAQDAHGPSVSPDGTTVAYHSVSPDGEVTEHGGDPMWGITLLDVESGTTRFLPHRQTHQESGRYAIAWSADGTQLHLVVDDLAGVGPRVLDVDADTVDEATPLSAYAPCHWGGPEMLSDGHLLVGCTKDLFSTWYETSRLRVIDVSTGEILDEVFTNGRQVTSIGAGPEADGAYVVLRDYDNEGGYPGDHALYRWSEDGGLEHVADDVVAVGW